MNRKNGLTLIEILIVITIIAVLIAFLMPVFNRAKVTAKKVESTQNLRILGLGQLQYAEDNQGDFAKSVDPGVGAWYRQIRSYCKTNTEKMYPPLMGYKPDTMFVATGYAINHCTVSFLKGDPSSSRTVLLFELTGAKLRSGSKSVDFTPMEFLSNDSYLQWHPEVLGKGTVIEPRQSSVYNGVGSYFFVDSHVKFLPPSAFPYDPDILRFRTMEACKLYPSEVGNDNPTFNTSGG